MCPQPMITGSNPQACGEVIRDSEQGSLPIYGCPEGCYAAKKRYTDDQDRVEPVDVFIPILGCHLRVGDMGLFRIIRL